MRTIHYVTLTVILMSLTRSCYGLDEICIDNGNCTGTGEVCQGSSCVCDTNTHYRVTGQSQCSPKLNLKESECTNAATQCADAHTECSGGTSGFCQCTNTHYDNNGDTQGGACDPKAELGAYCQPVTSVHADESCVDQNAQCTPNASYQTCQCKATHYDNNGDTVGGSCDTKVNLGESCTQAMSGSSSPCNTNFAVCSESGVSTFRCQCRSSYYKSGTNVCSLVGISLGSVCTIPTMGISATEACATTDAECDSSATCQCIQSHFQDAQTCKQKRQLGESCSTTETSCSDVNAECSDSAGPTCQCKNTHYDSTGISDIGGQCKAKVFIGAECPQPTTAVPATATCDDSNARCKQVQSDHICQCLDTYYRDGNICKLKRQLGQSCSTSETSCSDVNAECSFSAGRTCRCKNTHYDSTGISDIGGQCKAKVDLGSICPNPLQTNVQATDSCSNTNAQCIYNSVYKCTCVGDFYDDDGANTLGGSCVPKVELGYSCPRDEACKTLSASCSGGLCKCNGDFYDTNGDNLTGLCLPRHALNANCDQDYFSANILQCIDSNAICKSVSNSASLCLCKDSYNAENNICTPNNGNGYSCNVRGDCSDQHADCLAKICTCGTSYYDDNGWENILGNCRSMDNLKVSDVNFSNIETTALTITWTAPSMNIHVSYYFLSWRYSDNANSGSGSNPATNSTMATLTGLTPGKSYSVFVQSVNTQTQQNQARTTSVQSAIAAKPGIPIKNLDNSDLDADDGSIKLVWVPPLQGVVTMYSFDLKTLGSDGTTKFSQTIISGLTSVVITFPDLENGQSYNADITARSEMYGENLYIFGGTLTWTIRTKVYPPTTPRNVECYQLFNEQITLLWMEPEHSNGELQSYTILGYDYGNVTLLQNITHLASTNTREITINNLQPGTSYNFRVYAVNDEFQSTTYGVPSSFCTTKAYKAGIPTGLTATNVASRSITTSWSTPSKMESQENLGYVLQVHKGQECVQEFIYRCQDCIESFKASSIGDLCDITSPIEDVTKSSLNGQTKSRQIRYLLADTTYKITVMAINNFGLGNMSEITPKTTEEMPQVKPYDVRVLEEGTNYLRLAWSVDGDRLGVVSYNVWLDTDTAQNIQYVVEGFENKEVNATGLEAYWDYRVNVTISTSAGNLTSETFGPFKTLQTAPGSVSAFNIETHPGGDYTKMRVTWKAPAVLERNGIIAHYIFNTTAITNEESMLTANMFSHTYTRMVEVEPENSYSFEVYAVNTNISNGNGELKKEMVVAPAGPPINIEEKYKDQGIRVIEAGTSEQTTIELNIVDDFFLEATHGTVQKTALLGCKTGNCDFEKNPTMYSNLTKERLDGMPTWKDAAGTEVWRITRNLWLDEIRTSNPTVARKKKAIENTSKFRVGIENCDDLSTAPFCNGHLSAETAYNFVGVSCTNGGCTRSSVYGPFVTLEDPASKTTGMIVGITLAVLVIALVGILIFFWTRRRRRQFNEGISTGLMLLNKNREHSAGIKNRNEEAQTIDGRLNIYLNVPSGNRGKLRTDGQKYTAVYIAGCTSEMDYIICIAPKSNNVNEFWTMVFSDEVNTILMFAESKHPKKESRYWPSEYNEPKNYSRVTVEVTDLSTYEAHTHLKMSISSKGTSRTMNHLQCSPVSTFSPDEFVELVKIVRSNHKTGRILLHSCEGLGSTVPFVVLDTCKQHLSDSSRTDKVDVYKMLFNIVKTHKELLLSQEMFIFTHDCVQLLGSCDYEPLQSTQIESVYQTLQVDD